ncbi:hypothetical protein D3C87_1525510 [compost metagenome]
MAAQRPAAQRVEKRWSPVVGSSKTGGALPLKSRVVVLTTKGSVRKGAGLVLEPLPGLFGATMQPIRPMHTAPTAIARPRRIREGPAMIVLLFQQRNVD